MATEHAVHQNGAKIAYEDAEKSSTDTPPTDQTPPRPPFSILHEIAFVAILCSSQLLTQASLGNTLTPLHIIGDSFGTSDPGQLSWYVAAYSLTVGTFILIAGRLGDILGHKLLYILGYLWYGLWSLITGLSVYAHSQIFYDVCRAMQGIGPAILLPNAVAILGRTYPQGKRKQMIFSLFGATAPWGFIVGSGFASVLAEFAWWPWAYWCLAITCCLGAIVSFLVIPARDNDPVTMDKSFDYWGSVTGVAGLVLLNVAWNQAPIVGWSTPYVYILLIVGFVFLSLFFLVERKVATPLVPFKALSPKVAFVLGCIALGWSSFGIWIFYLWQFLLDLRGISTRAAAAQAVPAGISGLCAAIATGFLLSRVRPSVIMAVALLAFCVGNILIAIAPISQSYWIQTFLSLIITPWGMDMSFPAGTIILSDSLSREHQGIAASLVNTVVNYSISIGLGIAGTVQAHVNNNNNNNNNNADVLRGFRGAWYSGIGLSGLGVVLAGVFIFSERGHGSQPSKG